MCIDWWDFIFPWRPLFNAIFLAENSFGLLLKGGETDNKTFWWDYRGAFFHGFLSLGEWSRSGLVNPLRKCENYIRDSHENLFVPFWYFSRFCCHWWYARMFHTLFCICYIYRPCSKLTTQKSIDMSSASLLVHFCIDIHILFPTKKESRERMEGRGTEPKNNERCCVNKE